MSVISRLLDDRSAQPTCTLYWICTKLGARGSDDARKAYIEGLIETHGFPKPLPHLKHGGGISTDIHPIRSQWIRAGVEHWLGDYLPPAACAALGEHAEAAAAAEMDAAAGRLHLVGGTEA